MILDSSGSNCGTCSVYRSVSFLTTIFGVTRLIASSGKSTLIPCSSSNSLIVFISFRDRILVFTVKVFDKNIASRMYSKILLIVSMCRMVISVSTPFKVILFEYEFSTILLMVLVKFWSLRLIWSLIWYYLLFSVIRSFIELLIMRRSCASGFPAIHFHVVPIESHLFCRIFEVGLICWKFVYSSWSFCFTIFVSGLVIFLYASVDTNSIVITISVKFKGWTNFIVPVWILHFPLFKISLGSLFKCLIPSSWQLIPIIKIINPNTMDFICKW